MYLPIEYAFNLRKTTIKSQIKKAICTFYIHTAKDPYRIVFNAVAQGTS